MARPMGSSPATTEPFRPAIVAGRYRISSVIVQSETGDVLRGVDVREDREVILKRILQPSRSGTTRLHAAEPVLRGLGHPGVPTLLDLVEGRKESWLIWEVARGVTLQQWWAGVPLLTQARFEQRWTQAAPVIAGVWDALEAMHRQQLAHLDVKPSNVRIDPSGHVQLVDIGLGAGLSAIDPGPERVEQDLGFLAPELLDGVFVGRAADQWSLGALIYWLVAGRKAVAGKTVADIRRGYERGVLPPLRDWRSDTPADFEAVVHKLMAWDPDDRFASLQAAREVFGHRLGSPLPAVAQPWSEPDAPFLGRDSLLTFWKRRVQELRRGEGGLVQLVAEPGAGKTRLLERFAEMAGEDGAVRVWSATCRPGSPHSVLDGWFQAPTPNPSAAPPKNLAERALAQFAGPTAILLDAVEDCDGLAWSRIQRVAGLVARGHPPLPVLLMVAGRSMPSLEPHVGPSDARAFTVNLAPLSARELTTLLRPAVGEESLGVDVSADALHNESQGLPDRVVERLYVAVVEGRMVRHGRRWLMTSTRPAQRLAPPAAMSSLLSWLAELGGTVEIDLLLGCLPAGRRASVEALRWAMENEIVRHRRIGGLGYVVLRLHRESGGVDVVGARDVHAHIARWLELHAPEPGLQAERRAHHLRLAGEFGLAAEAFREASNAHRDIGAPAEMRRLTQLAMTLSARSGG